MKKTCKRCKIEQPLINFYKHKQMKDGHLNICKECKRGDSINQYNKNMNDFKWKLKERVRLRNKNKKLGYNPKSKDRYMRKYKEKYPEKYRAKIACNRIITPIGKEKHHWSYNDEHFKDVIFLDRLDHVKIHCYIEYFQPAKMYKTIFGEPLYTKERFNNFIKEIIPLTHDEIIDKFLKK